MDRVKPLKIENDGSQIDYIPTEANPNEDLLACLGLAFKDSDLYQVWLDASNIINFKDADFPSGITLKQLQAGATGKIRTPFPFAMNGTMSGGNWVSVSELIPDHLYIMPATCKLIGLSWSNASAGRDFDLEFYKNGTVTLIHTYQARNLQYGTELGWSYAFTAGEYFRVKYIDQGDNASDFSGFFYVEYT